jgi:uncharacterized protein YegJ (DUF2314 family)
VSVPADFYLDDGERRASQHPDTFTIPSREMRERLLVGDLVKLMFCDHEPVDGVGVERMWVEITGITDTGYVGKLDNEPVSLQRIQLGSPVAFEPRHVIGIWVEEGDDWPTRMATVRHPFTH